MSMERILFVKLKMFIKREVVLLASFFLAVLSSFFVHPSKDYIKYVDFRVLGILLILMLVVSGLQKAGVFDAVGTALAKSARTPFSICLVMVLLCFFFSMLITNDVALLTFVPFAVFILKKSGRRELTLSVVVLQTLAANLGSMLTPVGNPQNLYLYQLSQMKMGEFVMVMLPYTAASLVLLIICCGMICRGVKTSGVPNETGESSINTSDSIQRVQIDKKSASIFGVFFVLGILVVVRMLSFVHVLSLLALYLLIFDRKLLLKADYCLLLTFVFFFVFTGNLSKIPAVYDFLEKIVRGREVVAGVLSSQAISNVPAALLLSAFTQDYPHLLVGVNLGGLGTLIASMASLISYKIYVNSYPEKKGRYFALFTAMNVAFLLVLLAIAYAIPGN